MRYMTLDDFVRQVYYTQEKVVLDFNFFDDKYREVIMELNLVLQELQKEEDWLWLRERLVLGPCDDFLGNGGIREMDYIYAPWSSAGEINRPRIQWYDLHGGVNMPDRRLCAVNFAGLVTFNRKLSRDERRRIAVTDVQREIGLVDVPPRADEYAKMTEKEQKNLKFYYGEKRFFVEIPDPNYLVFRVAALHCVGSPVAQMRQQDLTDSAQKLLSAMREANAMATGPDHIGYERPGFINVL